MKIFLQQLVLTASLLLPSTTALNPVVVKGYKFFDSGTGEEVVLRGVDYFPRPNQGVLNVNSQDLFSDDHKGTWERDIPILKELGVNAIRLYAVDPSQNHDAFMCALEAAGIYVIVALAHDCPTCAITRDEAPDCYPPELKLQGQDVINAFSSYPNVLAFSAGNEVNHYTPPGLPAWNAPCQKKFLRDMRAYVDSCSHTLRKVPIGLISADDYRQDLASYYNCRTDAEDEYENTEWYGLNTYVACDGKAKEYSEALGLQYVGRDFENLDYSVPVLLTEFGCISETFPEVDGFPAQRTFLQAKWILEEPDMREQFSGGFAFEYSMEKVNTGTPWPFKEFGHQNFGLGYFGPEDCDDVQIPCKYTPYPTFDFLKKIYKTARVPEIVHMDSFEVPSERQELSTCPSSFPGIQNYTWEADSTPDRKCPLKEPNPKAVCKATVAPTASEEGFVTLLLVVVAVTAAVTTWLVRLRARRELAVPEWVGGETLKASESDSESDTLLSSRDSRTNLTDYGSSTDDLENLAKPRLE